MIFMVVIYYVEWGEYIFRKTILLMVMILLTSCSLKNELQDKEPENITISATDTKSSQEKEGSLEELHLVDKELGESEEQKKTMELYQLFLDGEISVEYEGEMLNAFTLGVPKGEPEKRASVLYSLLDVNGDGSPELILAFARQYLYLSVEDEALFVWRFVFSSFPLHITERKEHISQAWAGIVGSEESYNCYLLDYSGNKIFNLNFSRYDYSQDSNFDDKDEYTFDGVRVSREQWMELTRKYLYTDDEGNEQIKDEIEWKVLFEANE